LAREHAAIRLDMWSDDDWRARSILAQWLYVYLTTNATLNYAGVADWREKRIAGHAANLTAALVLDAAAELEEHHFIVTDHETEEVLVRSFLRHDGLLKKPNVTKAMVKDFKSVVSPVIRGVIVHELTRLAGEFPDWSAWASKDVIAILGNPSINPKGRVPNPIAKGSESDASLLTPNSLLLTPVSSHLATSANEVRDDVDSLCNLLADLIEDNGSLRPAIGKGWTEAARLMLDKDGRDPAAAARLIQWAQGNDFWKGNILSMPKFREKYDQLRLAANAEQSARQAKPTKDARTRALIEQGRAMDERQRKALSA